MDREISRFLSDISFWESWGYVALAAVVIGVIGKSVEEFTDWLERRGWDKKVSRLSALILIVGLAGEGVTQPNTNAANAKLIAYLNNQEQQARLARTKLEAKLAPRRLDAEAQKRIAAAVKRFAPHEVEISSFNSTPEAEKFADDLISALKLAGLNAHSGARGALSVGGTPPPLAFIFTAFDQDLAEVLASILVSEGVAEKPVPAENTAKPGSPFSIRISRKAFP